ncbi:hypothetical protein GQ53DRAFT_713044 [Thozetella sp. PMI_491]|nr:hypothetical protein GQ53DRAFT_713044 [Thozetella sp. PMI_491]
MVEIEDRQLDFAKGPCWTCRRRRLKCDSRLPTCFKCASANRECLGYSEMRPLVWSGLASRGKLVGRTFDEFADACENQWRVKRERSHAEQHGVLLRVSLTDPIFDGLKRPDREYMAYYEKRCCAEGIMYGDDSKNSFKRFISMMGNPAVSHTILAISACHQAHSGMPSLHDADAPKPEGHECSLKYVTDTDAHTQHVDGLIHCSKAIQALSEALAKGDSSDAIIVAVFLLGWVDMLESGKRHWWHHVIGMGNLLVQRRGLSRTPLQDSLEESFVVLSIFGSSLSAYNPALESLFPGDELQTILSRAEHTSWTGCPGKLMFLMYRMKFLSQMGLSREKKLSVLAEIREFPSQDWSQVASDPDTIVPRHHLACAFKGAVEIYCRRALKIDSGVPDDLVADTLGHILHIGHEDVHFKGIVWPTFVVGLESRNPVQKCEVSGVFRHLVRYLNSWNMRRAMLRLNDFWNQPEWSSWTEQMFQEQDGFCLA